MEKIKGPIRFDVDVSQLQNADGLKREDLDGSAVTLKRNQGPVAKLPAKAAMIVIILSPFFYPVKLHNKLLFALQE